MEDSKYNPFDSIDLKQNLGRWILLGHENTISFLEGIVVEEELPEDIRTATVTVIEHLQERVNTLLVAINK